MKTNFLFKLLLVTIICVGLYSCTADEITSTTKTKTDTSIAAKDGDPRLTNPR